MQQVKELCEELLYSESNQQLESVMRTAQSQPVDEMILADLEAELRKLHVTASAVRPLISAAQRDKYQTVASLELAIKRREQAAYAAGAQVCAFVSKPGLRLEREVRATRRRARLVPFPPSMSIP
jgi:hypothetical protein